MNAPTPTASAGSYATVGSARQTIRRRLQPAIGNAANVEASLLLGRATGLSRAAQLAAPDKILSESAIGRLADLVTQRAAGTPIAYLLGEREFWSLTLDVTPDVLIPRPETELLVEAALRELAADHPLDLLELGTGSGAIAVALAVERPAWRIIATDTSGPALAVARRNIDRHGANNVTLRQGDWFAAAGDERFDAVLSNPPYIAARDPHLRRGDLRFEPEEALAAGEDGLAALRQIVAVAPAHLKPGGWLILEHGYDQRTVVADLLEQAGFRGVHCLSDLAGQPRCTIARLGEATA